MWIPSFILRFPSCFSLEFSGNQNISFLVFIFPNSTTEIFGCKSFANDVTFPPGNQWFNFSCGRSWGFVLSIILNLHGNFTVIWIVDVQIAYYFKLVSDTIIWLPFVCFSSHALFFSGRYVFMKSRWKKYHSCINLLFYGRFFYFIFFIYIDPNKEKNSNKEINFF